MKKWLIGLIFGLSVSIAHATSYYISPSGLDSGTCTNAAPCKTLTFALGVGTGGDTYIYKAGTYNYSGCEINSNVKSGSVGAFTIIKAENDGEAVITQTNGLALPHTSLKSYVQVEGLKFTGAYQKDIQGYHLKFLRCSFKGGSASGNSGTVMIGSNDYTPVASDVLMEDCWFYGLGGRYNLVVFNAEKIILRRLVGRHEGGWNDGATQNPEAVFTVYNSSDVRLQNVFAIDSTSGTYHTFGSYSSVYLLHNPSASPDHAVKNVYIKGSMVAETKARCYLFETQAGAADQINGSDLVCQNPSENGFEFTYDNNKSTVTNVGVIQVPEGFTTQNANKVGMGAYGTGSNITATNIIFASMTLQDFQGINATYFDTYGNGTNATSGTGRQIYNPRTNGWLYPLRIESASNLETNGNGSQIGPKITTKWGTDGAMWGDTGYDSDSGNTLWPYPNEARIKTDLCAEVSYTSGLCASTPTLTTYLWQKFGNTIPASIYGSDTSSPTAPTNLSTTAVNASSLNISWTAATDNIGVSSYQITVSTKSDFSALTGSYNALDIGNVLTYSISGLSASTQYYFYLTAKDAAGNTSVNSSTQTGTTSAAAPPPTITFGATIDTTTVTTGRLGSYFLVSGVTGSTDTLYSECSMAKTAGVGICRINMDWDSVESASGTFSYTNLDNVVKIVTGTATGECGMELLMDMPVGPTFTADRYVDTTTVNGYTGTVDVVTHYPTRDMGLVRRWVTNVVGRYKPNYIKAGNEPDNPIFWHDGLATKFLPNTTNYLLYLSTVSTAAKAAFASVKVDFGALSFPRGDSLELLGGTPKESYVNHHYYADLLSKSLADGSRATNYIDITDFHLGVDAEGGGVTPEQCISTMTAMHAAIGVSIPIWVTEFNKSLGSYTTTDHVYEEYQKANLLYRDYSILLSSGVERVFFQFFHPYTQTTGVLNDPAMVDYDFTPRNSYNALLQFYNYFNGYRFLRTDNSGNVKGTLWTKGTSLRGIYGTDSSSGTLGFTNGSGVKINPYGVASSITNLVNYPVDTNWFLLDITPSKDESRNTSFRNITIR